MESGSPHRIDVADIACEPGDVGPAHISGAGKVFVRGEVVRLGDVARIETADPDAGRRLAAVSLGPAPKPGKSRVLDRGFLLKVIGEEGFPADAFTLDTPETVAVVRESRRVGEDEVRERVEAFFKTQSFLEQAEVHLVDFSLLTEAILPVGDYSLDVEPPARGRVMGSMGLDLTFQCQDGYRLKARATAKLEVMIDAVLTVRALDRGRSIEAGDIKTARVELSSVPAHVVADPKSVIGKKLKRHLPALTVLRAGLVDDPPLVSKGDIVTIYAESGGLRVTALGQAREDGQGGEQIRIVNLDSRKELHARVVDNRTVKVSY